MCKIRSVVCIYFILFGMCCNAQTATTKDSITVQLNNTHFVQGDTINFEVTLQDYVHVAKKASIQLWMEDIKSGKRWKYRYPLINGYLNAKIVISPEIGNGVYALNFLLQKTFFNLQGNLINASKNDKLLSYVMIAKDKETLFDVLPLDETHQFKLKNLLFQDSAFIIFSKPKQKNNNLLVNISTQLDSAFIPACTHTQLITVGPISQLPSSSNLPEYNFKADSTKYKLILPEVIVKTKLNKKVEDFERENTSGLFSGGDAILLDGISSDEIANAPDLYTFISIKVPGLKLEVDNENGNRSFTWRNQPTEMYINEIKLDPDIPVWINPADIAMIKVFRPGMAVSSGTGTGGAIAIYTKTGEYNKTTNRKYSFFIVGYTGLLSVWK